MSLFSSSEQKDHRCVYSIHMLRRPSYFRPSSVYNFKHLVFPNCLANEGHILCGASNESLFAASGSHDQDGHYPKV